MYKEEQLVRIAKRENNNKRNYLVVNRLQGKHIPVVPKEAFAMFEELADCLREEYTGEKLLLVGFAETATAIGAAVAISLKAQYMQTTREPIPNVEYLFFSESHSHATEQKLVKNDVDSVINQVDRVIFVEDEVTTGNTILKIVDLMEQTYGKKLCFSVASILNGMDASAKQIYDERNIACHYLVKTDHAVYAEKMKDFVGDGAYFLPVKGEKKIDCKTLEARGWADARRLVDAARYEDACAYLWRQIAQWKNWEQEKSFLVIGTEECMYPALYVAEQLERQGKQVVSHSTTRSPIVVSSDSEYPLHTRYQLESLYDPERKTFLYDIGTYDVVLIVTDAHVYGAEETLLQAVAMAGNSNCYLVRWCK